jgi:hypothetical protein
MFSVEPIRITHHVRPETRAMVRPMFVIASQHILPLVIGIPLMIVALLINLWLAGKNRR